MTVAIANAPVVDFPGRTANIRKSRGAIIALLVTALAIVAVAGRSDAAACAGTPLSIAEVTLPDLTHPA